MWQRACDGRWRTTLAGRSATTARWRCRHEAPAGCAGRRSPLARRDLHPVARAAPDAPVSGALAEGRVATREDLLAPVAGLLLPGAQAEPEPAPVPGPDEPGVEDRRTGLVRPAVGAELDPHSPARPPVPAPEREHAALGRLARLDRHAEALAVGRLAGERGGRQQRHEARHGLSAAVLSSITGIVRGARSRYCTQPG